MTNRPQENGNGGSRESVTLDSDGNSGACESGTFDNDGIGAWESTKLKDIYRNPIGQDIIDKILLQTNLPKALLINPIVGNLSLRAIGKLSGGRLTPGFRQSLARLLETGAHALQADTPGVGAPGVVGAPSISAPGTDAFSVGTPSNDACSTDAPGTDAPGADVPGADACCMGGGSADAPWWKESVFYQIYPRSFADGNGDSKGDLLGIIDKLDYLKELGIGCIWLSPIYDSPGSDNGYDIRDYMKIDPQYGSIKDFDLLLAETHKRGMRLIMDLVINHTSDEHAWFKAALADKGRSGYYMIREGSPEKPPNNWSSFFSGPAWNYYPEQRCWAMCLFSKKQMDLNWENPTMRKEIYAMIRAWLEKGIDGFRLDVINYISKTGGLPDGDPLIGDMMGYSGIEHYFFGPRLLPYLREMRKEAFDAYNAFTVGETPGLGLNMQRLVTSPGHLDLVFGFDHLENPGKTRFDDYAYDLNYLKKYLIKQSELLPSAALYFENHDNPRMPSKVDPSGRFCSEISRLLAFIMMTMPGTPFIFQGQELGETNTDFKSIGEIKDVESLGLYYEYISNGAPEADAFRKILAGTRDHSRQMIDWTKASGNNVFNCFRDLIALRKKHRELICGDTVFHKKLRKGYFCYTRSRGGKGGKGNNAGNAGKDSNADKDSNGGKGGNTLLMECNLTRKPIRAGGKNKRPLFSTYGDYADGLRLRPYEGRIYET